MTRITYIDKCFRDKTLDMIEQANKIINEYTAAGYSLTLRQLYYQFVARDLLPNTQRSYKRLGGIVNDGRMSGMISWRAIEDRTRNLASLPSWESPAEILYSCAYSYRIDHWLEQPYRVEVWIEKEALAGVFARAANRWNVPYFSCRGYTSQSEMWAASQRLIRHNQNGQDVVILHFGDHDPSGIDMTRDIEDRLATFGAKVDVRRLALNMDQVDEHNPPPNPAKLSDSRATGYVARYGDQSWELDALEPAILAALVDSEVESLIEMPQWEATESQIARERATLREVADRWDEVAEEFTTAD